MAESRDRAAGWKHAKCSGHQNESAMQERMESDPAYRLMFLRKIGRPNAAIAHIDVGGLCETDVDCIFSGEKTKSKTDMHIILDNGERYNISIKKSLAGQVYLITDSRFINGFEKQYHKQIPETVKRAIRLFWGSADDTAALIAQYGTQQKYEQHKHRLVADSLKQYKPELYDALLQWFQDNISDLTDFCFAKGLAVHSEDWANIIWYKNELGENPVNEIFILSKLCKAMTSYAKSEIEYGTRGGGTTIQLPFGFVQWHSPQKTIPGCLQFHHRYEKIKSNYEKAADQ